MINELTILYLIENVYNKFSHHKKIQENKEKCARDIKLVLEALSNDLKFETTIFTTRIANRFWYNGECQLKSTDTEINVYNYILLELQKILNKDKIVFAENSIKKIIEIIKNGPEINDFGTQLSQDVLRAEHCQRNWDASFIMPEEDLDVLIKVATTMPTKQNRNYYKLIVSTDLNFNKKIHKLAANPKDPDTPLRNNQVAANALFIYVTNKNLYNNKFRFKLDPANDLLSVGISSGALALAAAQIDYRVGFCRCFLSNKIIKTLKKKGIDNIDNENVILIVGVGKPNPDHQWNSVVDDQNQIIKNVESYQKFIKVKRI
jgi:nitroreductase